MSTQHDAAETLDVQGVNCPMPIIETKQAIETLAPGEVLEVLATDPGSVSDMAGWAEAADGVELVDQVEEADRYRHYVRREA